jgi:hypothetical protein
MARSKRKQIGPPFPLIEGVPFELFEAIERGAPDEAKRDLLVIMFSSRDGDRLVELGGATGWVSAMRVIVDSLGAIDPTDPDEYFTASDDVKRRACRLERGATRELALMFATTFTCYLRDELENAAYLENAEEVFPGHRFVIGWGATGPMIDVAYAVLERPMKQRKA